MTHKSMHHSFDIDLAAKYGVHEAIIIHHFQHWIRINKKLNRNFHEGSTWTYQTIDEIAAHFSYLSKSQVFDIIEKLCDGKGRKTKYKQCDPVLKKGNFNKSSYDHTLWYAFIDEGVFLGEILGNPNIEMDESQNQDRDIPKCIPDTKPHTETSVSVCSREREEKPSFPEKIKKKHCDGQEVEVSLKDIFFEALRLNKTWKTSDIEEAWKILVDYQGGIRDPFRFIEGTVQNIQNKERAKKYSKNKEESCKTKTQQATNSEESNKSKPSTLASDMPGRPSLGSLLEKEGLM